MKKGDRVRVVAGKWASDCATVIKVLKSIGSVRVQLDTRDMIVTIKKDKLEVISC